MAKNFKSLKQLIAMLILITPFLKALAQGLESGGNIIFQYATVPSLGKHQLDTFLFSLDGNTSLGFADLSLGVSYQNSEFFYFDVSDIGQLEHFERFHLLAPHIGISRILTNDWHVTAYAKPVLSSNLLSSLSREDIILGYKFEIQKRWQRNDTFTTLALGIEYGTTASGTPSVFPVVRYHKKIGDHFAFALGYPFNSFTYLLSDRHTVNLSMSWQGFYYNNSESVVVNNSASTANTKLVFNGLDFQAAYLYKIQPRITTAIKLGYLASNTMEIATSEGSSLNDFSPNDSIYFSIGLTYNLKMDLDGHKK